MTTLDVSRREFIKASGTLVVSFSVAGGLAACAAPAPGRDPETLAGKSLATDAVDGFVSIDGLGNVLVFSGKVDLGTGIKTAMTQIAADELGVPLDRVRVVQGDTLLTPDQGPTFGSLSIQVGGMQIRQAAATAREALIDSGAAKLGVARDRVEAVDGAIRIRGESKSVTYGDLIGDRNFSLKVDREGEVERPHRVQRRRQVDRAARYPRQGHRAFYLYARLQSARDGACARRASDWR